MNRFIHYDAHCYLGISFWYCFDRIVFFIKARKELRSGGLTDQLTDWLADRTNEWTNERMDGCMKYKQLFKLNSLSAVSHVIIVFIPPPAPPPTLSLPPPPTPPWHTRKICSTAENTSHAFKTIFKTSVHLRCIYSWEVEIEKSVCTTYKLL